MNKKEKRYLDKFYKKLYNNINREKNFTKDSIIITFIKTTKNKARDLLRKSTIESNRLPKNIINKLQEKDLIRSADFPNEYVITAKGVWEIERNKEIITDDILIDFFDNRKFDFFGKIKGLSDREKVILLSMIAARTFSKDSVVDLKKEKRIRDEWKNIVEDCYGKLKQINVITKGKKDDIFGEARADPPIVNLFRHTESLPRKTKNIFKSRGKNLTYYLDLSKESEISKENLAFVFWLIFGDALTKDNNEPSMSKIQEINQFLKEISTEKSVQLFDIENHKFSEVHYDDIIRDSLIKSVIWKKRWEKA